MYLAASYPDASSTADAVRRLKEIGFGPSDISLFSTEPVQLPPGLLDRPSRMSLAAVIGALVFGTLATAFIYYTQYNYAMLTGGMPIFSFWATGVPSYELTMLGAVVTTFGWFLWESGLLRPEKHVPLPKPRPDRIGLRLRCDPARRTEAGDCLLAAGAPEVETLGEAG